MDGKPYPEDYQTAQRYDKDGIITSESTGMNCIGFVTYMYGIKPDYSVENFENYTAFEKLSTSTTIDGLKIGDVIRWQGTMANGKQNNHVQIYAGNGYVWESAYSPNLKDGIRYLEISSIESWYKKNTTYTVDYFTYKGKKK